MTTKQKNVFLSIAIILGVLAALSFWYYLLFGPMPPATNQKIITAPATTTDVFNFPFQSNLDGTGVQTQEEVTPRVVAVMIDNHPDARPQAGISKARVVYEVPVEGTYTRFMALYALNDTVEKVGPVRSARPYFVHWAEEYGLPMYMHSGGSPDGLALLASSTLVYDTNEFWNGSYFWRDSNLHSAPHNLYTKSDSWQNWFTAKLNDETGLHGVTQSWNFVTSPNTILPLGTAASSVVIPYASDYTVEWQFDTSTNKYERYENNKPKIDQDGSNTYAANIIAQYVDIKTLDSYGRKGIAQNGNGDVVVYTAGRAIKGTWNKIGSNRTRWYDALGTDMPLMYGTSWIEVVQK